MSDQGSISTNNSKPQQTRRRRRNNKPKTDTNSNTDKGTSQISNRHRNRDRSNNNSSSRNSSNKKSQSTDNMKNVSTNIGGRGINYKKRYNKNQNIENNNISNHKLFKEYDNTKNDNINNNELQKLEIERCQRVLGNKAFKLFRRGKKSVTYGYTIHNNNKNFNEEYDGIKLKKFKITIEIFNDYPKSDIRITLNQQIDNNENKEYEMIKKAIKNFNMREKKGESILSDINYFNQNLEILSQDNFNKIDNISKKFYEQHII